MRFAIPVKNSTLSFSNSTRSDMVVSGSYLKAKRRNQENLEVDLTEVDDQIGNLQLDHPV